MNALPVLRKTHPAVHLAKWTRPFDKLHTCKWQTSRVKFANFSAELWQLLWRHHFCSDFSILY